CRYTLMAASIWRPVEANGPVIGRTNPIFTVSAWANTGGTSRHAVPAPASNTTSRREIFMRILRMRFDAVRSEHHRAAMTPQVYVPGTPGRACGTRGAMRRHSLLDALASGFPDIFPGRDATGEADLHRPLALHCVRRPRARARRRGLRD